MTAQFARAPYRGRSGGSTISEPHAALLIDFDNVTMGIRSDLTKELKNLLNSDIIKGKVAVQRAYADWRRYPQYIVPLAESSVDLIFAPAYGSAKKNATDIRLAIDAVELVFTRPEIGTIILLSGDSDFSSLVLKLKEYGKYVIGVGIRESASDLLVQNCDEYYSYSALTGLTRAGDETPALSEDPWELVEMALRQMTENDDVMRSDRLKQVLLEMDPGFDEKTLGFQKFNKFLQEAANRGILSLRKQENGQFEVGPPSEDGETSEQARAEARELREGRSRRGRRGRGRRDERDGRNGQPRDQAELPGAEPEEAAVEPPRYAEEDAPAAAPAAAAAPEVSTPAAEEVPAAQTDGIAASYDLLRRAMADLTKKSGPAVRDSDVKRRMLELQTGWNESDLGFSKFSRFLRTAHDAQVITLRKGDNGVHDVLLGDGGVHIEAPQEERGGRRDRDRGRGRDRGRDREPRERTESADRQAAKAVAEKPGAEAAEPTPAAAATAASAAAADAEAPRATQATPPAVPRTEPKLTPAAPAAAVGFRRGSRGRVLAGGPPPLLEGQTARLPRAEAPAMTADVPGGLPATPQAARPASVETEAPASANGERKPRGRKAAAKTPRASAKKPAETGGRGAEKQAGKTTERSSARKTATPRPPARVDVSALGLPTEPDAIVSYMAQAYSGVGPKSVQSLIDAVGANRIYEVLEKQPDRVREVMGAARGDRLIDGFVDDVAARRAQSAPDSRSQIAAQQAAQRGGARKGPARPRGRSGARKQPRK
jgi:uncharacterized protein (TIGR00288 family)